MTSAAAGQRKFLKRRIYLAIGALMIAIAIAGFWPSYFGRVLSPLFSAPPVIHLHAAVFTGWLILVIAQAWLAASGRIALHRSVGNFIFVYGVALIFVGYLTALQIFAARVEAGNLEEAGAELFVPVTDLLFFAPPFYAAWAYRRKPEIHKRLIIVATTVLLIAAVHRFVGAHVGRPPPLGPVLLIWLSPIAAGMAYDFATRRIVHPVYLIGIALVLGMKLRSPLFQRPEIQEAWLPLTSWLAKLLVT